MDRTQLDGKKEDVMERCICKDCPSWKKYSTEELGFCLSDIGKSKCIEMEIGCICPQCPIANDYNLKELYYCTRGSDKEQSN